MKNNNLIGKNVSYVLDKLVVNGAWHIDSDDHKDNEKVLYRWYGETYAEMWICLDDNRIVTKTNIYYR